MKPCFLLSIATCCCLLVSTGGCDSATETTPQPATLATALPDVDRSGIDFSGMDPSIRPQDDFHQYTNGKWLRKTRIPEQYSSYSAFVILAEQAEQHQREIIEELAAKGAATGTVEQQIGDYYASFMDIDAVNNTGLKPLQPELEAVAAVTDKKQLTALFARFMREGITAPLDLDVDQDLKQSERYTAYLGQAGLGLPNRDYYLKRDNDRFRKVLAAYPTYIEKLFSLAGIADGEAKAAAIVDLETRIAGYQWSAVKNRDMDKIYNPTTRPGLRKLSGNFDWAALLSDLGVGDLDRIIVTQPDYISGLGKLLESEPLDTWKAYLQLRLLSDNAPYLSQPFVDANFDFYGRVIAGKTKQRERWRLAIDATDDALGQAVGRLYVARYFPPEAKARMEKLVDNLLAAFASSIDDLDWMSDKTRSAAREKLAKFTVKIGYPDKWRDYSGLKVERDNLLTNLRASRRFEYDFALSKLGKPIDRSEWHMTPQTINAYYNPSLNEIVFPAAILQPPFFNMAADDAVNYGAIGMVIGHEISHGFDDQGSKFDGGGNLHNWWTDADRRRFEARTRMLVKQYSRFSPVDGMHVNGELTLGENIGDLSGLTVAYRAYRHSLQGKPAPVIDGLSGDQRFFLGFAQSWRSKYREQALVSMLATDPHSPPRYRVNGVLENMPAFYRAFDVQQGDALYLPPSQRVKIW